MASKLISLGIAVIMLFSIASLTACGNNEEKEMKEILKQFDLTEPKERWTGSIDDDFSDDIVILVLRRTFTYPELELRHFRLENAESLEYIGGA